jgi:hypothetical protein
VPRVGRVPGRPHHAREGADGAPLSTTVGALVGTNPGLDGTGNSVRINGFEEWTFGDDGLIAASLGHYDQTEYDRQLQGGAQAQRR